MKKIITVFLIVIFIFLFIIEVISFSITQTFIHETNILKIIKKNDTYNVILNKIAPVKIKELFLNNLNSYDKTYYEIISNHLLSKLNAVQLENTINDTYKNIILFLKNKGTKTNLSLDISYISKILEISEIEKLLLEKDNLYKLYNSLELCKNDNSINCKTQNLTFDDFSTYVKNELDSNNTSMNIPTNINLYENINKKNNILETVKQNYQFTKKIQLLILFLEIIIILIIIFINFAFVSSYLKSLSIMLLIPSTTLLLFSLIAYLNINKIANTLIINIFNIDSKSVELNIIKINFIDISNFIIKEISLISLSSFIIGIILIIISKKYKNRRIYEIQRTSSYLK